MVGHEKVPVSFFRGVTTPADRSYTQLQGLGWRQSTVGGTKNSSRRRARVDNIKSTPSDHVVRACAEQLCDTGVQLIPVAFHEPVRVILDGVVVVVDGEVLEPRVGF